MCSVELHQEGAGLLPEERLLLEKEATASCFFPSISLVNSMPVKADDVLHIAQTTNWDTVSKGGRRLDDRVKSAKLHIRNKSSQR